MNVYILSALSTYLNSIEIIRASVSVKGIIGLPDQKADDSISGYHYYGEYCKCNGLDFIPVASYSLTTEEDQRNIEKLEIDYLLVLGWQRLIPEWLIRQCRVCAIGAHGSADGITMGRGRSPQNWALILGKEHFYISIFKIDEGIDSGAVIATRHFLYNEHDTIATSYHKVSMLTGEMIVENLSQSGLDKEVSSQKQEGEPRYLPQRKPEDGALDWKRTTSEVHNFVRALSQPYPGAWTRTANDEKLCIWRGAPFSYTMLDSGLEPGQIVAVFHSGEFIVKTQDGYFIVFEWSTDNEEKVILHTGDRLQSEPYKVQIQRIVERHYSRYPDLIISEDITSLLP